MKNNLSTWLIKGAFVTLFISFGLMSFLYPPKARIIPLIITLSGLIVALIDCLVPQKETKETIQPEESVEKIEPPKPYEELKAWLFLALFFCLVILGGLIFGSAIFLFFFLKWFWKEKWSMAVMVPLIASCCIYLLFNIAFRMELYGGIFFE
jgi:hypothetical protein